MVKNSIKIFARLKREDNYKGIGNYEIIERKKHYEDIIFRTNEAGDNFKPKIFRFHKIFDQLTSQADVFETVAKPIINSVIEGFNGTIFAYGQTGSGKTYSITGSSKKYDDRGIIPRTIQHIFNHFEQIPTESYSIHISYMEIYNEIAYDLLSSKQQNTATRLEELPRVVLLEDKKGEAHIRHLSVLPVNTERDAMRLLFLGDTNRTIAETPMNEYSSRSHCIFTIYISQKCGTNSKIRSSKLHLVDLAGSERIFKSKLTGTTMVEAKSINLSLHFLEQVILALSENARPHIPYRNSLLTYILKDSLAGNCLTLMLATISINKSNIPETLSTCKFAQRVALVKIQANINEKSDPQLQIKYLQKKVEELQNQIRYMTGNSIEGDLNEIQKNKCKQEVELFLKNRNSNKVLLNVDVDMRQIQLCFQILKKEITELRIKNEKHENIILKQSSDIDNLRKQLRSKLQSGSKIEEPQFLYQHDVQKSDSYNSFLSNKTNSQEIDQYKEILAARYQTAKRCAETIGHCQEIITDLKERCNYAHTDEEKNKYVNSLKGYQMIYKQSITKMKQLKDETDHLTFGLEQAKIRLKQKYDQYFMEDITQKESKNILQPSDKERNLLTIRIPQHFDIENWENYESESIGGGDCSYRSFDNDVPLETEELSYMALDLRSDKTSCTKTNSSSTLTPKSSKISIPYPTLDKIKQSEKVKGINQGSEEKTSLSDDSDYNVTENVSKVIQEIEQSNYINSILKDNDTAEFKDFVKTISWTGDAEIDLEIVSFYRCKFSK